MPECFKPTTWKMVLVVFLALCLLGINWWLQEQTLCIGLPMTHLHCFIHYKIGCVTNCAGSVEMCVGVCSVAFSKPERQVCSKALHCTIKQQWGHVSWSRHDHSIIACLRHLHMGAISYSMCTSRACRIAHSTPCQSRGCNSRPFMTTKLGVSQKYNETFLFNLKIRENVISWFLRFSKNICSWLLLAFPNCNLYAKWL